MRIIPALSLFSLISLFITGCRSSALTDPWAYAPKNSYRVWTPEVLEQRKISYIEPNGDLNVPRPDESLSLGDLFDIGLRNNPSTSLSWQEAREAAASYSVSLAPYLPSLGFTAGLTSVREGFVVTQGSSLSVYTSYGPQVALNYLIWDSGQTRTNAEYYFQTLQQLNWDHNETLQTVMQGVAKAYYEHLYAKEMLVALDQDLLNAEQSYQAACDKVLSGIFNETEKMQAKTNYLQKKVQVTGEIATVQNSFVELLSVLGIPCDVIFSLGSFPQTPPIDLFDMTSDELIALAKAKRPDYQGAKAAVLAQESFLKNAKAQVLPEISLAATGGQAWYTNGFTDNGDYTVILNLTFPIFSGFYYVNNIRMAESQLKTSVAHLRSSELGLVHDVKTSHNTFVMAKSQLVDAKNYLESAQIEFKAMLERYQMGIVTILDLLSSEAFLSDARASYVKAQKVYFMSIIDISFATGLLTSACPWTKENS